MRARQGGMRAYPICATHLRKNFSRQKTNPNRSEKRRPLGSCSLAESVDEPHTHRCAERGSLPIRSTYYTGLRAPTLTRRDHHMGRHHALQCPHPGQAYMHTLAGIWLWACAAQCVLYMHSRLWSTYVRAHPCTPRPRATCTDRSHGSLMI